MLELNYFPVVFVFGIANMLSEFRTSERLVADVTPNLDEGTGGLYVCLDSSWCI